MFYSFQSSGFYVKFYVEFNSKYFILFFLSFFMYTKNKSLYWICYNTAPVLCFVFFGPVAWGILASWPGIKPTLEIEMKIDIALVSYNLVELLY